MFKRCLIVVLMLVSGCCAWGQDDWEKWSVVSNKKPSIDYDKQVWSSWAGSKVVSLWGKVYVAKPGEKVDFEVRIVKGRTEWSDLDIAITNRRMPYKGQWRFVSSREDSDFSIRFVDKDEHFSVRFISMEEWEHWDNITHHCE